MDGKPDGGYPTQFPDLCSGLPFHVCAAWAPGWRRLFDKAADQPCRSLSHSPAMVCCVVLFCYYIVLFFYCVIVFCIRTIRMSGVLFSFVSLLSVSGDIFWAQAVSGLVRAQSLDQGAPQLQVGQEEPHNCKQERSSKNVWKRSKCQPSTSFLTLSLAVEERLQVCLWILVT